MRKYLLYAAGVIASYCLLWGTAPAAAHVLITDTSKQVGAILHVQPDDDPIAGKEDKLFFDIQQKDNSTDISSATLTITDSAGMTTAVETSQKDSTVSAQYTFPAQGLYTLELSIRTNNNTLRTFTHTQRVARGVTDGSAQAKRFIWAEAGMVAATCALIGLGIVRYNHRETVKVHWVGKK